MSLATFLAQFEATGRVKGDGYSPSMFQDMSPEERDRARAMMLGRGLAGDTTDLAGLSFLGDEATVTALRAAQGVGVMRDPDLDIQRRETLFALTGDSAELTALLAYLDHHAADARHRAAWLLRRLALPSAFRTALEDRLLDGRHEDVALALAGAWLATLGRGSAIPEWSKERTAVLRTITRTPAKRRRAVLDDINRRQAPAP